MLVDELANLEPAVLHRMVTDRTGLSQNALLLGTCAHRPGIASFEGAGRIAGQAVKVGESRSLWLSPTFTAYQATHCAPSNQPAG